MYDHNSGYVGTRRSVRSEAAIESFEVPLSHINKDLISELIGEYPEYTRLKDVKVCIWKLIAHSIGATSWHHAGKYFAEVEHYDLHEVADELMENLDYHLKVHAYRNQCRKEERARERATMVYAVIVYEVWGGSRNHPKMLYEESDAGILKGDWVHGIRWGKHKVNARKTVSCKTYDTWSELTKEFPEFKRMSHRANRIRKGLSK